MGEKEVNGARFRLTTTLLDVDDGKTRSRMPRAKLFAVFLAIINLFPSGFSEQYLTNDPTGYYLSLFLFVHAVLYLLFASAYFAGSSQEILMKTRMFPVQSISRSLFVVAGTLRHPFSLALLGSNVLFLILLFRQEPGGAAFAVTLYLLLMVDIVVAASLVFLVLDKREISPARALPLGAVAVIGGLTVTVLFHAESFLTGLPFIGWCVHGVHAALRNDYPAALGNTLFLLLFSPLCIPVARRFL